MFPNGWVKNMEFSEMITFSLKDGDSTKHMIGIIKSLTKSYLGFEMAISSTYNKCLA
jgi:hypothetical protein